MSLSPLSEGEIQEESPIFPRRQGSPPASTRTPSTKPLSTTTTSRQFHTEVKNKLQKALTEYKLLFARWKRQPQSETDEFDIPEWSANDMDKNNILRWEFNFSTIERTVWHPLFMIMQTELEEAREEIANGKIGFANITLGTVDELLDRSLARNKALRARLAKIENPRSPTPEKEFVGAIIDLEEFADFEGPSAKRGRGGRGGGNARGGITRGGNTRGGNTRGGNTRGGNIREDGDLLRGRGGRDRSRAPRGRDSSRGPGGREPSRPADDRRRPYQSGRPDQRRRRSEDGRLYY